MSNYRRHLAKTQPLPYDAEVEYLEKVEECGEIQFDTRYIPKGNDNDIYIMFMPLGQKNPSGYQGWFRAEDQARYRIAHWGSQTKICLQNGSTDGSCTTLSISLNEIYEIWMYKNNTYSINGTIGNQICNPGPENTHTVKVFNTGLYGRFYAFKWYKADKLVLDIIPVRKGDTGYLYDKVSGKMYENTGEGRFALGPDKK